MGLERYRKWRRLQKLLFHARPQHHEHNADSEKRKRYLSRDLRGFLLINGCFHGAEFHDFFLFVIVENRVDESNHAKNQKYDSENHHNTLHRSERIIITGICIRNASGHTRAPTRRKGILIGLENFTNGWRLLRRQLFSRPWLP